MEREQVITMLESHKQDLTEKFGVKALYLFGSVARDQATKVSDVDFIVDFSRPIGLFDFIELQHYLEKVLDTKVDLGTRKSLKIEIRDLVRDKAIRVT